MRQNPSRRPLMMAAFALSALGALAVPAAQAGSMTWNWNFTGSAYDEGQISGTGTLTAQQQSGSRYLVTSITGIFDNYDISGLFNPGSLGGNDNLLYGNPPSLGLDYGGVSFGVTRNGHTHGVNLYQYFGTDYVYSPWLLDDGAYGQFSLSAAPTSSVPEPGSLALFAGALGLLGALAALKRRRSAASRDDSDDERS